MRSLKSRLAKQEQEAEKALSRHPLGAIIPVTERAPLTLAEWHRLAELHDEAMARFRARIKGGTRLLTGRPEHADREEELLLSGADVFVDESEAFNLLAGESATEATRLILKWWEHRRAEILEAYLSGPGLEMPERMKAEMRLTARR